MLQVVLDYSPYKGLVPYTQQDSKYFFGRDRERRTISASLRGSRLTVLYGESGAGKSSLLAAGVAADLANDPDFAFTLFRNWHFDPTLALAEDVQNLLTYNTGVQSDELKATAGNLTKLLQIWQQRDTRTLLIVLDQFEEYFQYHPNDRDEDTLAGQLPDLLNKPDSPINFLFAIREDALSLLDRFKGSIPGLFDNLVRVKHLSRSGAREAIIKPLDRFNQELRECQIQEIGCLHEVEISPECADAVIDEIVSAQDIEQARVQAAYLQLVMTRWWNQEIAEGSSRMELATITKLGGIRRIVGQYLEDVVSTMSPQQQMLAAAAFEFMVTPGGRKIAQSVTDLSSNASILDLVAAISAEQTPVALREVVENLQKTRLLAPVAPPRGSTAGESYFEFAHDEVAKAAYNWRRSFRQQQELSIAKRRFRRWIFAMTALFVVAIFLVVLSISARRSSQRVKETRLEERAQSVSSILSSNSAQGLLAALEITGESWREFQEISPTVQANLKDAVEVSRERAIFPSSGGPIVALAMSPNGKFVAFNSGDGKIHFLTLTSPARKKATIGIPQILRPVEFRKSIDGPVGVNNPHNVNNPLAISPEGDLVLTSNLAGTGLLLAKQDGTIQAEAVPSTKDRIIAALFSPSGKQIVSASVNGNIRLWDSHLKSISKTISIGGEVYSAAVTDEKIAFARKESGLSILDWAGKLVCQLPSSTVNSPISVAFSPSGILAAGTDDGRLFLFDSPCDSHAVVTRAHSAAISGIAFHPDGKRLATASADHSVRIWNLQGRQTGPALLGHEASVQSVVFDPSGNFLVTASAARPNEKRENSLRIWDTESGLLVANRSLEKPGFAVAFSHDSKLIATTDKDRDGVAELKIWTSTGLLLKTLSLKDVTSVFALSFTVDDASLVALVQKTSKQPAENQQPDNKERLLLSLKKESPKEETYRNNTAYNFPLILNQAGDSVFVGSSDGLFHEWSPEFSRFRDSLQLFWKPTGTNGNAALSVRFLSQENSPIKEIQSAKPSLGVLETVEALALNPESQKVALAERDHSIMIEDHRGSLLAGPIVGHTAAVSSLLFSHDGQTLASSSLDGTVRLWDMAGVPLGSSLQNHEGGVQALAFSPDDGMLAAVGDDQQLRLSRSNWRAWFAAGCELLASHPILETSSAVKKVCAQSSATLSQQYATWQDLIRHPDVFAAYAHRLGEVPLHLAARSDSIPAIQSLLDSGSDPSEEDEFRRNAAQCAFAAGHVDAANYILENNPRLLRLNPGKPEQYVLISQRRMPAHLSPEVQLARAYETGKGQRLSLDLAMSHYRAAAERGDSFAEYAYGWMLYFGTPSHPSNFTESYGWISQAASRQQSAAINFMGSHFSRGDGGFYPDPIKAESYFLKSAALGDLGAISNLCIIYADGEIPGRPEGEVSSWCKRAALVGDQKAQYWLGLLYLQGRGVPQSYVKAANLFRQTGAQNSDSADYLAWQYENGLGVARSDVEAAKWYRIAAMRNDAEAQLRLGRMYEDGTGVVQSLAQARIWYHKAEAVAATAKSSKDNLARLGAKISK